MDALITLARKLARKVRTKYEEADSRNLFRRCFSPYSAFFRQSIRHMEDTPLKFSNRSFGRALLLLTCVFNLNIASAARKEDVEGTRNLEALNKQHETATKKAGPQGRAQSYAEILGLDSDSTFKVVDSSDVKGWRNYRFQQMFRGLPIDGAVVVLSEDVEGSVRSLAGSLAHDLAADVPSNDAALPPQQAIAIAKREALTGRLAGTKAERQKAEKVIYIDDLSVAHLAYKVSFFVAHPSKPVQPNFFIDANSGEVLGHARGFFD